MDRITYDMINRSVNDETKQNSGYVSILTETEENKEKVKNYMERYLANLAKEENK